MSVDGNEILKLVLEFLALALTVGGLVVAWVRGAIKTARELAERLAQEARDEVRTVDARLRAVELAAAAREAEWRGIGERLAGLHDAINGLRTDIKGLSETIRAEAEREVGEHERRCGGYAEGART